MKNLNESPIVRRKKGQSNEELASQLAQKAAQIDLSELQFNSMLPVVDLEETQANTVDLIMFMGQSNMAGRGVAAQAPAVKSGAGYEFRAISDPTKLYNIVEPFGVNENNASGITETTKTGSMVSAFVNEYYNITGVPVVGISASKGGSSINLWQPNGSYLNDSINRFKIAKAWLLNNGYKIRRKLMVWCQGETDGDNGMTKTDYTTKLTAMIDGMVSNGIERCLLVRIGNQRDNPTLYDNIMSAQTDLCKTYKNAVLISTRFASMATEGMMKDLFHYTQEGYNLTGAEAGKNAAFYVTFNKKPYLYDYESKNVFAPKNAVTPIRYFWGFESRNENGLVPEKGAIETANSKAIISAANTGFQRMKTPFQLNSNEGFTIEWAGKKIPWVNGTPVYEYSMLLSNGLNTGDFLSVSDKNNFIRLRQDATKQVTFNTTGTDLTQYHKYVITYDGVSKLATLYIDGVQHSQLTFTFGVFQLSCLFGGYYETSGAAFYDYAGQVDYLKLSNTLLTPSEFYTE